VKIADVELNGRRPFQTFSCNVKATSIGPAGSFSARLNPIATSTTCDRINSVESRTIIAWHPLSGPHSRLLFWLNRKYHDPSFLQNF